LDLNGLGLKFIPNFECEKYSKYGDFTKNVLNLFLSDNKLKKLENLSQFINLEVVDCSSNLLDGKLDIKNPKLIEIQCRNNNLKYIEFNNLKRVDCSHNQIKSLGNSNYIQNLIADCNKLEMIGNYGNLTNLSCKNNNLEKLGKMPNIKNVDCAFNRIKCIKNYTKLKNLWCNDNMIEKLENLYSLINIECTNNLDIKMYGKKSLKNILCDKNVKLVEDSQIDEFSENIFGHIHIKTK